MAHKGDPFIKRWHDLFVHLWGDKTDYDGIGANPLLAFAATMDFSAGEKKGLKWELKVDPELVYRYVTQCLAWTRVSLIEEPGEKGFNDVEYQRDHVLYYHVLPECWLVEPVVGFPGQNLFDALATDLQAKVTHGKNLAKIPALESLWDAPENEGKDTEPGTFAELLLYGSVNFRQTRKDLAWEVVDKPKETIKKGLFEP